MNRFAYISGSLSKFFIAVALALVVGLSAAGPAQAQSQGQSLYVVTIGISDYRFIPDTKACKKDAEEVAAVFQAQQGKTYSHVEVKTLVDADASAANILQALQWARSKASANSTVVVFFAGHGDNKTNGQYEFMAHEFHPSNWVATSVSWQKIKGTLDGLPGKTVLMLNSCFSGAVSPTDSLIVMSSSRGSQVSFERLHNGFFSGALLEALGGKADANGDGVVTLGEVDVYVSGKVLQVTKGVQHPMTTWPAHTTAAQMSLASVGVPGIVPATATREQSVVSLMAR